MACLLSFINPYDKTGEIIQNFPLRRYIFYHINEDIMCIFKLTYVIKAAMLVSEFIDTQRHLTGVN